MIIRLATPADIPTLTQLRYQLRSKTVADVESKQQFLDRCSEWMARSLKQLNWRCWVVEQDQTIFATLWLQLIEKIPNPTREPELLGYITNVFVAESQRAQGIGSQLLTTAINFCKQEPVQAVILWPTEKSHSLYERHGFVAREDSLELTLF